MDALNRDRRCTVAMRLRRWRGQCLREPVTGGKTGSENRFYLGTHLARITIKYRGPAFGSFIEGTTIEMS